MSLNPNQRIYEVLCRIRDGVYRMPDIQRGFVWDEGQITRLLDSIFRGYPFGSIIVWQPAPELQEKIQTREFAKDYVSRVKYNFQAHRPVIGAPYLVLDGQQRLQSLFIAFFGSYEGKRIYFRIDQPVDSQEDSDCFEFLLPTEAKQRPEVVPPEEIISQDARTKGAYAEQILQGICAGTKESGQSDSLAIKRSIIQQNVDLMIDAFNMKAALHLLEIERRCSYEDVLEIFQRVNSGGTVLTKSDLIFCTLKFKLRDIEDKFSEILEFLNAGGHFRFSKDFLIKTCLVVFDQGAKYEVEKLDRDDFITRLDQGFGELRLCLRALRMWLDGVARIRCVRFLRSENALIPLIDFMMLSKIREPEGTTSLAMLQYLYIAFFSKLFGRSSDAVLDELHNRMRADVSAGASEFPLRMLRNVIQNRTDRAWNLLASDVENFADLMLNIVGGGLLQIDPSNPEPDSSELRLERDHIFARKLLADHGLGAMADQIGNYRLIRLRANRRKSARAPIENDDFFSRNHPELEPLFNNALHNLNEGSYLAFCTKRAELIRNEVSEFLHISFLSAAPHESLTHAKTGEIVSVVYPENNGGEFIPGEFAGIVVNSSRGSLLMDFFDSGQTFERLFFRKEDSGWRDIKYRTPVVLAVPATDLVADFNLSRADYQSKYGSLPSSYKLDLPLGLSPGSAISISYSRALTASYNPKVLKDYDIDDEETNGIVQKVGDDEITVKFVSEDGSYTRRIDTTLWLDKTINAIIVSIGPTAVPITTLKQWERLSEAGADEVSGG